MKKIILAALLFLGLCAPVAAQGTCPYIVYGATLTVAQWQSCFSAKQNVLGYVPVNKAGDTMQGRLVTSLPGATAGFNVQPASVAPASPVNGDMWITPSGFFVRAGGSTIQPYVPTGTSGGVAYFNSTTTLASSTLLTSHGLMVGGGVGAAPSTLGSLGTTTTILHGNASGNPTFSAVSLTADVSGILPSANGGTNNAFFTVSGPTTSAKTFSFPNASATVLTDNAVVTGAQGGTGVANTGKTITIGGNVSTGSTLSTTGAFSTGGAFSTSSTVSVTGALSTSAALTTTGAGATTLAFGASTQTYTYPSTTATLAGLGIAQSFTANQTINGAALAFSGNISGSGIFGTSGIKIQTTSGTLSDTTSSGTVATNYNNLFGGNTQTATSSTTITNNFGSYFAAPTCSTNVTCTANWALGADSINIISGNVNCSGTCAFSQTGTTSNALNGGLGVGGSSTATGNSFLGRSGVIGVSLRNDVCYGWAPSTNPTASYDSAFCRDTVLGAGNVDLGNGTANNKSGTLNLASITMTGTLTTGVTGGGTQCAQVSNTGVLSGTGAGCGGAAPSAMMHLANNTSIASNGVAQIIPLDTIDFDTAGICSAVSHVCTPTTAGKYRVTCRTQINGSGTLVVSDNRAAISGRKNGSNASVNFSNYAAGSGSGGIAESEVNGIITVNGSSDTIGCWGSVSFNVFSAATFLGNGDNVMIINYVGP